MVKISFTVSNTFFTFQEDHKTILTFKKTKIVVINVSFKDRITICLHRWIIC